MKYLPMVAMFLFLSLAGCVRTHTVNESPEQIAASVELSKDDFTGAITARTKTKAIDLGWTSGLTYFYRYDSRIPDQVQLYVGANLSCWPKLNRAVGQDTTQMSVVKIASDVRTGYSVYCVEEIGINVPLSYLEKMTAQDWTFRLYGASTSSWDLTIDRKLGFNDRSKIVSRLPSGRKQHSDRTCTKIYKSQYSHPAQIKTFRYHTSKRLN